MARRARYAAGQPPDVGQLSAASRCAAARCRRSSARRRRSPTCGHAFGVDLGRTAQAQFGSPKAGGALSVDVRVRAPCAWSAVELSLYYHRDALRPTSSNPTEFRRAPAGAWVDNAGDNLAGTFTLPDGATDEYDFVVTIVGQPASAVAAAGADGTLIGTVGFTVVAEGGEHFLAADGEVVCADGSPAR